MLLYVAILAAVIGGVVLIARAATRMSRPARIIVAVIAMWTIFDAIGAFLNGYQPNGDWVGGLWASAFEVLYGLIAAGIVLAVDTVVKRRRATSPT